MFYVGVIVNDNNRKAIARFLAKSLLTSDFIIHHLFIMKKKPIIKKLNININFN